MRTLQNYGNTLVPLMIEYTTRARYSYMNAFDSTVNSVFFTLLPNVFIRYNMIFSWIAIALLLIGSISLFIFKKVNFKKALIAFSIWFVFVLISAGIGFLISIILAVANGATFSIAGVMNFITFDRGFVVIASLMVCVLAVVMLFIQRKVCKLELQQMQWGGIFISLLFLIITAFVLHGATFLFLWPATFVVVSIAIKSIKHKNIGKFTSIGITALVILACVSLGITIIYSLFVGMTISVLFIILALSATALSLITSSVYDLLKELNSIG